MLSRLVRSSKTLASIRASPQVRNLFSAAPKQGNLANPRRAINDAADPRQAIDDAIEKIRQELSERKKREEAIARVIVGVILATTASNLVYDSVIAIRDWAKMEKERQKERRAERMEILAEEEQLASKEQLA